MATAPFVKPMFTLTHVDASMKRKLEPLFANHHGVDFGIPSILEGKSGKQISVVVNDLDTPDIALLRYGVFGILAGNADHTDAEKLLRSIQWPCAIQPSPEPWIRLLQNTYAGNIKEIERFSFSHQQIDVDHLKDLIAKHTYGDAVRKIDLETARYMENDEWNKYHLINYNSPNEFVDYGFGNAIKIDGVVASACSAALRCSEGIELNIITLPAFRNKGLALAVAAHTILQAFEQDLIPHWDAANQQSLRLAMRLGYKQVGSYYTHYISM
jgi:RimJ/RimL family protein N-acetyltransferase